VALVKRADSTIIPVESVGLAPLILSLIEGETAFLNRQVFPLTATNPAIVWTSGDPSVAVVDQNGMVTAIQAGHTSITVTTVDGNYTSTSNIDVAPNTDPISISGFTLVNAENNTDLLLLSDNQLVDISEHSGIPLNIRADVLGEDVKSIAMELSGPVSRTWLEHQAPFALFGDLSGDYYGAAFPEGDYILSATPFAGIDASGVQGALKTISFTITSSPDETNQPPEAIVIAAPLSGYIPLQVDFDGSNSTDDQEISAFFWDFGDGHSSSTSIASHTFTAAGRYDVLLTVTDAAGFTSSKAIVINVLEPEIPERAKFTMVEGTSNTDLFDIVNNMLISADSIEGQKLNIRANLMTDQAQSVAFILNGEITRTWIENEAPFMLFGDHGSKNQGQLLTPGEYFLEARAYSDIQLGGNLFAGGPALLWYADSQYTLLVLDALAGLAENLATDPDCTVKSYPGYTIDEPIRSSGHLQNALKQLLAESNISSRVGVETTFLPVA
ncbi:MAG: PKD domain-containing protein, partial [Desulfobulbaceae bacterium]